MTRSKHMERVPYALAAGSLMYVIVCMKPNIAHKVEVLNRYMSCPGKRHFKVMKLIVRYLKGTQDACLYFRESDLKPKRFVDSDLIGNDDSKKSTIDYVFTSGGSAISWVSNLQK